MKVRLYIRGVGMTLDDITDDIHRQAGAFFAPTPYRVESVEVYPEQTMTGSISHNIYEAEVLKDV